MNGMEKMLGFAPTATLGGNTPEVSQVLVKPDGERLLLPDRSGSRPPLRIAAGIRARGSGTGHHENQEPDDQE
jgi:hypothetical protein